MTPENYSANLALGLLPALSAADLMEVVAVALSELNRRGGDVTPALIEATWGDISKDDKGGYRASFYDHGSAEEASEARGAA